MKIEELLKETVHHPLTEAADGLVWRVYCCVEKTSKVPMFAPWHWETFPFTGDGSTAFGLADEIAKKHNAIHWMFMPTEGILADRGKAENSISEVACSRDDAGYLHPGPHLPLTSLVPCQLPTDMGIVINRDGLRRLRFSDYTLGPDEWWLAVGNFNDLRLSTLCMRKEFPRYGLTTLVRKWCKENNESA